MTSYTSLRTFFFMYVLFTFGFKEVLVIKVESNFTNTKYDISLVLESNTKLKQEGNLFLGLKKDLFRRHRRDSQRSNPCEQYGSCSSNVDKTIPICYCDNKCGIFNDCCYDAKAYINGLDNHEAEVTALNFNDSKKEDGTKAISSTCNQALVDLSYKRGIHLIDKCPTLFPIKEVAAKCERKENKFPVSSSDGMTYHNAYCAACNNIHEYEFWTFKFWYRDNCTRDVISANVDQNIMSKIEWITRNCLHAFTPPENISLRVCFVEPSVTLPCANFMNPVVVHYRLYPKMVVRNIDCVEEQNKTISHFGCIEPEMSPFMSRSYGILDMVGMLNIRPAFEILGQMRCQSGYRYFSQTGLCLPEDCENDQTATTERCNFETMKNTIWRIDNDMTFIADDRVDILTFGRILILFQLSLPKEKYELSIDTHFWYECKEIFDQPGKFCCFVHDLNIVIGRELTVADFNQFKSSVDNVKWTYQETRSNATLHMSHDNKEIEEVCKMEKNISASAQRYKFRPASIKRIHDTLLFNNKRNVQPEVPLSFSIEVVQINSKDGVEAKFKVKKWKTIYRSPSTHQQKKEPSWSATTILTYVTLGASSISLLIAMVVYRYLGLSLTPPGIISQNMMGTLLTAQLLFLSGAGANAVKEICLAVGIISHYIWLSAFTWITVFMINVLRTMRRMYTCPGSSVSDSNLSKFMYCFGYLLPIFIVLPCALLDIFSDINIGYTDGLCFPTGYPANLFAFSLPILVSLIINLVALAITSFSIARFNNTKVLSSSIQGMQSFIPIYIRLISICSFPWIIGMLSDILDLDPLRYLFIILAGCQGTFVSVSFLTAKSVRSKIRNCFRTKTAEANVPLPPVTHTTPDDFNVVGESKEE